VKLVVFLIVLLFTSFVSLRAYGRSSTGVFYADEKTVGTYSTGSLNAIS